MNEQQLHHFISRLLASLNCEIVENTSQALTCRLTPEADKLLFHRPYYWDFIEQTGAKPEPLTIRFLFCAKDPENSNMQLPITQERVIEQEIIFGNPKWQQLCNLVRMKGKFVQLFEQYDPDQPSREEHAVSTWLGVNYRIEWTCDRKRSELHSYGIDLQTGKMVEQFYQSLSTKRLSAKLPQHLRLQPTTITLEQAHQRLETNLQTYLQLSDHIWALKAIERLKTELQRLDTYFIKLADVLESDERSTLTLEHLKRQNELNRQYQPKIHISVVNAGLFHLFL
jgi:hypothetical protein